MRMVSYTIYNKKTNERVFTSAHYDRVLDKFEKLEDKENYEIRNKWFNV